MTTEKTFAEQMEFFAKTFRDYWFMLASLKDEETSDENYYDNCFDYYGDDYYDEADSEES